MNRKIRLLVLLLLLAPYGSYSQPFPGLHGKWTALAIPGACTLGSSGTNKAQRPNFIPVVFLLSTVEDGNVVRKELELLVSFFGADPTAQHYYQILEEGHVTLSKRYGTEPADTFLSGQAAEEVLAALVAGSVLRVRVVSDAIGEIFFNFDPDGFHDAYHEFKECVR